MRLSRVLIAYAAPVAALLIGASPASAATWTVSGDPEGTYTATGALTLDDASGGTEIVCDPVVATGRIADGTYATGEGIATVDTVSFGTCSGPFGLAFTVEAGGLPWAVNAETPIEHGAAGSVTCVQLHLTAAACDVTAAGAVPFTFTNPDGHSAMAVLTGGDGFVVTNVDAANNCFGLIATGDVVRPGGTFAIAPDTLSKTGT